MTEERGFALNPNCGLAEMRAKRHRNGRDLKIVITQRNSETGGGKSVLAAYLAMGWAPDWDGEKHATVSAEEFLATYPNLPEHSVLILDEAEALDARRSMSQENVEFSKDWMMMRTRQIDSILTLPTTSALDNRLLELADVRINVVHRGKAKVYRIKVDDHNPARGPRQWFMHDIEWPDLSSHPEFRKMDEQKQDKIDERGEKARKAAEDDDSLTKREQKRLAQVLRNQGMTLMEISEQDEIEFSHNWVSMHTEDNPDGETA